MEEWNICDLDQWDPLINEYKNSQAWLSAGNNRHNGFDLWTPEYGLMMDQIQGIEGVNLGDHDFEVWSCFAKGGTHSIV